MSFASQSSSIQFVRSRENGGNELSRGFSWINDQNESKENDGRMESSTHLSMQQLIDDYEQKQHDITQTPTVSKRRRTRFDIVPGDIQSFVTINTINMPTSKPEMANEEPHQKWITTNQLLSMDSGMYFQELNNRYDESAYQPVSTSFEDDTFKERIRLALQKNFNYIERMDNLARERLLHAEQILLHGGGIPSLNKFGTTSHPAPSSSSSATTAIRSRFQDRYNKARPVDKKGIGARQGDPMVVTKSTTVKTESTRIYVSGFPSDITEEEIEILFAPQGKIKKIKLYTDAQGNKKGDCLITYQLPESAVAACIKLNKLNIGDGNILSVSKADFTSKESSDLKSYIPSKSIEEKLQELLTILQQSRTTTIPCRLSWFYQVLPTELPIEETPIIFIWNAYDPQQPLDELREIESDMLVQASNFGRVEVIHLFNFPESYIDLITEETPTPKPPHDNSTSGSGTLSNEDDSKQSILGCIAIAFEDIGSATACQVFLAPQYFCERKLFSFLHLPSMIIKKNDDTTQITPSDGDKLIVTDEARKNTSTDEEGKELTSDANPSTLLVENSNSTEVVYCEEIQKDLEDVEDFLNSLL